VYNNFFLDVISRWCLNAAGDIKAWNDSGLLCEQSLVGRYIPPSVDPTLTDNANSVMFVEIKWPFLNV
jgi:hypothetical protein